MQNKTQYDKKVNKSALILGVPDHCVPCVPTPFSFKVGI